MGLRRKIIVEFSLPLIISLTIIILAAYLPFLLSYSALIDELIDDMAEDRREIYLKLNNFTSGYTEALIQATINVVLLADYTLQKYENGTLSLSSSFNYESVPINGKLFETYKVWPEDWDPKRMISREPEWYLDPNNTIISSLPQEIKENLKKGAILDSILGTLSKNPILPGYNVGFSDGLLYIGPTRYRNIFKNDTIGLFEDCDQLYINATCTPWYRSIPDMANEIVKIKLTRPFYYNYTADLVQEVCIGTYKNFEKTGAICTAFNFEKAYRRTFKDYTTKYVVDKNGNVIFDPRLKEYLESYHKDQDRYKELDISITSLEFNDQLDLENAQIYNDNIIPLFNEDTVTQKLYKNINNTNTILNIHPIHLRLSKDAKKEHTYGIGSIANYYSLEVALQDTKSQIGMMIIIEGAIAYLLTISLSILIYFASMRLYSMIVKPLNDLSSLICQMHSNLDISFSSNENYNSYEICLLYIVFERLKIIMRLRKLKYFKDPKDAVNNYTISYRLFKQVNNIKGMFYSTYHLGFLAYLRKDYRSGIIFFTTSLELSDMMNIDPYLLLRVRKGLILCYYQLDDMNSFMILVQSSLERIEANLNSESWDEWADTILLQCDYLLFKGFPVQNLLDVIKPTHSDPNPIILQKLYYMQAVCYKSEGKYRDAMNMLFKALVRYM